jgi:hypothetical protein
MMSTDPEPYVLFDVLRMLGKGGTHLPTLGYRPINTTLIYQLFSTMCRGRGRWAFV